MHLKENIFVLCACCKIIFDLRIGYHKWPHKTGQTEQGIQKRMQFWEHLLLSLALFLQTIGMSLFCNFPINIFDSYDFIFAIWKK